MKTVGDLIDDLFKTHRKPDGKEYTHKEVSVELGKQGTVVDPSYLSKLRNNKVPNPGRDTLLGLCRVFKVPPSYFFPELEQQDEGCLSSNDPHQLRVALRKVGLDPEVQDKIEQLIRALQAKRRED